MKKIRNHVHAIIELLCEHGNDHSYDVVVALALFTSLQFYIGISLPIFTNFYQFSMFFYPTFFHRSLR